MADATYDPEAVIRLARERARQIVAKGERIEQFKRQGFVGKIEKPSGLWVWTHG